MLSKMIILCAVLSYLLGAIPTGYIIYRITEKRDIRGYGSQATGATNVLRLKGWKYAIPVGIFDVAKGFLPMFLALRLFADERVALLCGFLTVLGHTFPVFIQFKGGKGVATAAGAYLALAPVPALISVGVFLIIAVASRYVSLGSLLAMLSFPFVSLIFKESGAIFAMSFCVFLLILLRHKGNIQRLAAGKERKLGEKEA
jgi:glycerol-3-phosphate acyltransferase PlsY